MITRFALPLVLAAAVVACSNESATTSGPAPAASSTSASVAPEAQPKTITAAALHQRLQSGEPKPLVVDVREPSEFEDGHLAEAQLVPLGAVENGLADVPKEREIILICRSGRRSGQAQERLAKRGYTNLTNVEGGMIAWEDSQLPIVK